MVHALNKKQYKGVLSCLLNHGHVLAGFVDPFDPSSTVTLDHPAYRYFGFHLMKGKLDWLLLRKMKVLEKSIGNHDYAASDHKWLSAYVQLC